MRRDHASDVPLEGRAASPCQWNDCSTERKRRSLMGLASARTPRIDACTIAATCNTTTTATFREFLEAAGDDGVHIVCAAGPESIAAGGAAGQGAAPRRAQATSAPPSSASASASTRRRRATGSPTSRRCCVVGLRGARAGVAAPEHAIDAGSDGEPLVARAFALAETVAPLGDATWCAAIGLVDRVEPHVLVERALARATSAPTSSSIAALLDAAARGPEPARRVAERLRDARRRARPAPLPRQRAGRGACGARKRSCAPSWPAPRACARAPASASSSSSTRAPATSRISSPSAGAACAPAPSCSSPTTAPSTAASPSPRKAALRESVEARLASLRPALADEGATHPRRRVLGRPARAPRRGAGRHRAARRAAPSS